MIARRILAGSILVASLVLSSSAAAKKFTPGDLSICNAKRCVVITSRSVLSELAAFYYDTAKPPARTRAPRLGTPLLRLEFPNGYITGILAGADRSKFLSYGVNLDQFRAGVWYRVPTRAAAALRALTVALTPVRLTNAALSENTIFATQGSRAAQPTRPAQRPKTSTADRGGPWLSTGLIVFAALVALALLTQRRRPPAKRRPVARPR